MEVRIIGAGAVGMAVAYKLKGHCDLAFIVDSERKARYAEGLFYNDEPFEVGLVTPEECNSSADLVIVAVKNFQMNSALDTISPFVGDNTTILPLLNGISSESVLSARFGKEKVLYGLITDLSSNHSGNRTKCFSDGGTIIFGEYDNSKSRRVECLSMLFEESKQKYKASDDIHHDKWWKFMLNTCFNTISAILEADYHAISGSRNVINSAYIVAKEVQRVAIKESVNITDDDIDRMITRLLSLTDSGKTSMLQDVLAHRDTENEYFAGAVSRIGKKDNIPTPICDFLTLLLEAKRDVYNS